MATPVIKAREDHWYTHCICEACGKQDVLFAVLLRPKYEEPDWLCCSEECALAAATRAVAGDRASGRIGYTPGAANGYQ